MKTELRSFILHDKIYNINILLRNAKNITNFFRLFKVKVDLCFMCIKIHKNMLD